MEDGYEIAEEFAKEILDKDQALRELRGYLKGDSGNHEEAIEVIDGVLDSNE